MPVWRMIRWYRSGHGAAGRPSHGLGLQRVWTRRTASSGASWAGLTAHSTPAFRRMGWWLNWLDRRHIAVIEWALRRNPGRLFVSWRLRDALTRAFDSPLHEHECDIPAVHPKGVICALGIRVFSSVQREVIEAELL